MTTTTPPPIDLKNVQGDILAGLPKKVENYCFFQVDPHNVTQFRTQLAQLVPLVTSASDVANDRDAISKNKKAATPGHKPPLLSISGLNIAFSQAGLTKLGITDDIGDAVFKAGQLKDAQNLGDSGTTNAQGQFTPNWVPAFKNEVDGVIFISGDCQETVNKKLAQVEGILRVGKHDATIHEVLKVFGNVRPGDQKGHEHFGFLDGISNPAVAGFDTKPNPGQETVPASVILLQNDGTTTRPPWAINGSFLAFRYLFQLVPEFNDFLKKNPINLPGLTPAQGSEFLGARLVGRWKSGAPLDLAPLKDDPALGVDPLRNNNFSYTIGDDFTSQTRCPFAAHVRKTNPRNDLEQLGASTSSRRIIRRGIQFGPEVTPAEARSNKTQQGRGLLFVCYQSNLANGFQFIQHSWANNVNFPPKAPVVPGFDPIIGQNGANPSVRSLVGVDPNQQGNSLGLPAEWVVSRGGEYFFSPSISALRDTFALTPHH